MTLRHWLGLAVVMLAGCVTTGEFKQQVAKTETEQQRADNAEKALAGTRKDLADAQKKIADEQAAIDSGLKLQHDLEAKIKADDDQIAALQKSNKDLTGAMDAGKSALQKKLSALVQEKDALSQKLADLTKATDAQMSDLNGKVAQLQAAKEALQKEKDDEIARVKKSYDEVTVGLKSEINKGSVQINQLKGRLTLNVVDKVLFATGEATINDQGRRVLDHIGAVLNNLMDKDIRIEGNTDNVPISGELARRFPTNWELSTARATAVARYLQDKDGVEPKRLVAAGFGEYRPVAPNDSEANRALNRRIEIVLVPRE